MTSSYKNRLRVTNQYIVWYIVQYLTSLTDSLFQNDSLLLLTNIQCNKLKKIRDGLNWFLNINTAQTQNAKAFADRCAECGVLGMYPAQRVCDYRLFVINVLFDALW